MISNPKAGQQVQCWYAQRFARLWPFHGAVGVVKIVGRGRPRSHGVLIGGVIVVVPAGNLRPPTRRALEIPPLNRHNGGTVHGGGG